VTAIKNIIITVVVRMLLFAKFSKKKVRTTAQVCFIISYIKGIITSG
jgi:hypothetical protein